jgi:hypothetical protein
MSTIETLTAVAVWEPTVLPPLPEPIITYCQKLAAMKKGDGIAQLKKWRLHRAKAYKVKTGLRHEYVSVFVVNSDSNQTNYVAIERRRGDLQPLPSDHADIVLQPIPQKFPSSNSSLSIFTLPNADSSSPTRHADDQIAPLPPSGMWQESDELVSDLVFEKPVYLYELAVMALIVHRANPSYLLITSNCYHFTGTIIDLIKEKYGVEDIAEGADAGKWCGLNFTRKKTGKISLLGNYEQALSLFVSFVPMLSN